MSFVYRELLVCLNYIDTEGALIIVYFLAKPDCSLIFINFFYISSLPPMPPDYVNPISSAAARQYFPFGKLFLIESSLIFTIHLIRI